MQHLACKAHPHSFCVIVVCCMRLYSGISLQRPLQPRRRQLFSRPLALRIGMPIHQPQLRRKHAGERARGHHRLRPTINHQRLSSDHLTRLAMTPPHACVPLPTQCMPVLEATHLALYARRDISIGEELTFDYHYESTEVRRQEVSACTRGRRASALTRMPPSRASVPLQVGPTLVCHCGTDNCVRTLL